MMYYWTGRWSRPSLADRNIIVHLFYYQTYKVIIINRRRVVNRNGLSSQHSLYIKSVIIPEQ